MAKGHVPGKDAGKVTLYALSTCIWCKKTRELLGELGVAYDYEYVDLLEGDEKASVVSTVRQWNPAGSYPTLVVNGKCIVGFREHEIREVLKG